MKFDVLGLGESISRYVHTGNQTIGVNDIWKYHKTDYVVCVDLPEKFTEERLNTILESDTAAFITQLNEWMPYFHQCLIRFWKIDFAPGRGSLEKLDSDLICYSNNSTYIACIMAWKLGAKELYLYGVDFKTHKNFKDASLERALKDFKQLYQALTRRGVKMYVTAESRLSEFIPTIP